MNLYKAIKSYLVSAAVGVGVLGLGLLLAVSTAKAAEPLTVQEAAALLGPSVFSFGTTGSDFTFCTATKIAPRQYLTALHCAQNLKTNYRLESEQGEYAFIRSVIASVTEKKGPGKDQEDWAILVATGDNDAPSLPLGCGDLHYIGEPIAYTGFPEGLIRAFAAGYISTFKGTANNADFFVDAPVAPGASGASIISLDTGHIIGVVTEGVVNTRTREFYLTGIESVEHVDQCKDWAERMKHWESISEDPRPFIPAEDPIRAPITKGIVDWT